MTIEEKARAYDETLEKAREALNDGIISSNAIAYLQDIFPELAESEDERIRKSIIDHLQSDIDDMSKSDCPFDFEAEIEELSKYIAWLEKQSEKFIPEDINEAALQYVDTCAVDGEITHDNVTESYLNNHSMMKAYKAGWLKNQTPKSKWSEEDEHRLKDTIYFLDTAKKHYASIVELDACIDWLKSIKQRMEEQQ